MFDVGVEPPLVAEAVGDVLAALAEAPGSPGAMALLAAVDPEHLTLFERVDLVRVLERQASWVAAVQSLAIAALERPEPGRAPDPHIPDAAREELAAALRLSMAAAQSRLELARDLSSRLVRTADALRSGALTAKKADVIAKGVQLLSDAVAAAVEERVLPEAPEQTPWELRKAVMRAVLEVDPEGAAARAEEAQRRRGVECYPLSDGMASVSAFLRAADAQVVMTGLECEAGRLLRRHRDAGTHPDDVPDLSARMADALVLWAKRALTEPAPPTVQGRRPRVQVTVSLTTLLGLDEAPGQLAGYGPVDADTARRLAADGTWQRLVTDPLSGAVLDLGRTVYEPPADLREFILARYPTCPFPGCGRPARHCHLDHIIEAQHGGETSDRNLHPACLRHHICKTADGWTVTRDDDGSITWTSPAGKSYTTRPAAVGPPDPVARPDPGRDPDPPTRPPPVYELPDDPPF